VSWRPLDEIAAAHYTWALAEHSRVPLGFEFFDNATSGGIARGEVAMFLARSGVGKSWWACNVVNNNADVPTMFFSLEMQDRFMLQRLTAVHMGEPTPFIENEIREWGRSAAMEKTVAHFDKLAIIDTPNISIKEMSKDVRAYEERYGTKPHLVLVDYLELLKAGMSMSALEGVDMASRRLKDWAREEDVALIVLHQTNSSTANRIGVDYGHNAQGSPVDAGQMALTRQSARFGGDTAADYTIAMYKPSLAPDMPPSVAESRQSEIMMQLLKNRGGHILHSQGVEHHVDVHTWQITEKRHT